MRKIHLRSKPRPKRGLTTLLAAGFVFAAATSAQAQQSAPANASKPTPEMQALLDRIDELERRLSQLESTAVLSAPKVLVKEVHVWVDKDGNAYDHAVPGA